MGKRWHPAMLFLGYCALNLLIWVFWTVSGGDILLEMHAHIVWKQNEQQTWLSERQFTERYLESWVKRMPWWLKHNVCNAAFYSKAVSSGLLVRETEIHAVCSVWAWERNIKNPCFLFHDSSGKNASCPQSSFFQ